ncbi:MAG: neutral/alkaline non-lysosomal ceramidase N-terminal domain-containing protein [Bryobacterales bacterium]|nr:neutral/alkaline non-lysosomal ceramidase N-terminal domain-containing protein [Bryobacterales bacterium]
MSELLAGVGRCDITPAPGTPQGGWGAQTHQRGLGADMPMLATALAISSGSETVVVLDVDAIGFDEEWTGRILDAVSALTGLPRRAIRFSCTHTHSGPNTFRLGNISEGLDMVLSYLDGLPLRIAGAAWQALQNLRPARCAAGSGRCEIGVNRRFHVPGGGMAVGRNWEGPVDPTVRVVRFDALDETPLATLVHYSCHPTTIAWQNQFFTPDYPGAVRQTVERELGGTCLFLQGAAGNITPRGGFTGDLAVYRRLGQTLGLEASRVALSIATLPRGERFQGVLQSGAAIALYDDQPVEPERPVLRVCARPVRMPVRNLGDPEPLEEEAGRLRGELNRLRSQGAGEEEIRAATARATQAGWRAATARNFHGKQTVDWQMQGIRLGSIALLCVQGEPFVEIGLRIAAGSPFPHTLFSGYSNGAFGYIPIREAFEEGGYEVWNGSVFSPDAAGVVAEEGLRMLHELAE